MTVAVQSLEVRAALGDALGPLLADASRSGQTTLVSATVEVAVVDPVSIFDAARDVGADPSLWLQPDRHMALVSVGEAWSIHSSGESRFREVAGAWAALLDGAPIGPGVGPRGSGPLLFGGFGFAAEPSTSPPWRGFETARFVTPSLLLTSTAQGAWLTVSLISTPGDRGEDALHRLTERWEGLTKRALTSSAIEGPATALRVGRNLPEAQQWRDSVARLAGAVGRGRVDKVVLSRQVELEAESPIDVGRVLRRLSRSAPESTVFAVTRGARAFVGATPERLVSVAAREFETMAMAGSVRRADDAETDAALGAHLLQSDKEREEHAVVVAMLREALGPVAETLQVEPLPQVAKLRHVQHLLTPMSGRLREDSGVLALVERLHPTPAVGGAPRKLALELIADEEHHERGWYAGPLGWVDGSGDGEFVVALRSGVIDGTGATLFAGCGIMADSDPEREWDESSTKLLALSSELGRMGP